MPTSLCRFRDRINTRRHLARGTDAACGGRHGRVLSIGLGSAFAGTSPVGLSAPLRRLKSGFTGGVNRQSGAGKIGCR